MFKTLQKGRCSDFYLFVALGRWRQADCPKFELHRPCLKKQTYQNKQTEPRNRKNAQGWKTRQDNLKFEDKVRTQRLETEEGTWPVRTLQDQNCNKQRGSFQQRQPV